jgi:uncharacterized protein YceK
MSRSLPPMLTILLVTGCATIGTVGQHNDHPTQVYSGTSAELSSRWAFMHMFLDVPFSVVADTIVLPYTIPATIMNSRKPPDERKNVGLLGDGGGDPTRGEQQTSPPVED